MTARLLGLTLVWVALFREVTPGLLAGGLMVAALATAVVPADGEAVWRWWKVPRLVRDELLGILHATVVVLRVLVRPGAPTPAVIDVSLPGGAREAALVGALLTLTPGTYVVDMAEDGTWLRLHLVDESLAAVVADDVRRLYDDAAAVTSGPTHPVPRAHVHLPLTTDPENLR